jgi:hypothetical protein
VFTWRKKSLLFAALPLPAILPSGAIAAPLSGIYEGIFRPSSGVQPALAL